MRQTRGKKGPRKTRKQGKRKGGKTRKRVMGKRRKRTMRGGKQKKWNEYTDLKKKLSEGLGDNVVGEIKKYLDPKDNRLEQLGPKDIRKKQLKDKTDSELTRNLAINGEQEAGDAIFEGKNSIYLPHIWYKEAKEEELNKLTALGVSMNEEQKLKKKKLEKGIGRLVENYTYDEYGYGKYKK
jgi:hypothetical protein